MSNFKFKVGDKVKLIGDKDSVNTKRCEYGEIATIREVDNKCSYPYTMEKPFNVHIWRDTELKLVERVNNPKIVITTDGVKYVTAKLYEGDTVKVAEAKCAPEDTFDFMVGAKLACERLSPKKEEPPKPKYYNGKVVCVKAKYTSFWTPGKIYEITEGDVADNRGKYRGFHITCVEDARHMGDPFNEFIPLVEE